MTIFHNCDNFSMTTRQIINSGNSFPNWNYNYIFLQLFRRKKWITKYNWYTVFFQPEKQVNVRLLRQKLKAKSKIFWSSIVFFSDCTSFNLSPSVCKLFKFSSSSPQPLNFPSNHWKTGTQICSNDEPRPFQRGDNSKIKWSQLKESFFAWTTRPTNLKIKI